jgi:hypothetical protein
METTGLNRFQLSEQLASLDSIVFFDGERLRFRNATWRAAIVARYMTQGVGEHRLQSIVLEAIKDEVVTIHFDPLPDGAEVVCRIRQGGQLKPWKVMTTDNYQDMTRHLRLSTRTENGVSDAFLAGPLPLTRGGVSATYALAASTSGYEHLVIKVRQLLSSRVASQPR